MKLTIILAVLLAGCTPTIFPEEHDAAIKACEQFGGVSTFEPSPMNYRSPRNKSTLWMVQAHCKDGTSVKFRRRTYPGTEE